MRQKLTLTIDKKVIEKAKLYAKSNRRSLSNIVEAYLKSLVQEVKEDTDDFEISPLVRSLWGSVKTSPESFNYKDILAKELIKKYLK